MGIEIKFRVWDADNNSMRYFHDSNPEHERLEDCFRIRWGPFGRIMQYIGIDDSDGNSIYEGDILKITIYDDIYADHRYFNGEVVYDIRSLGFRLIKTGSKCDICSKCFNLEYSDEIEVIGNIHENPELLEIKYV